MRISLFLFLLVLLVACKQEAITYEQARMQHDEAQEKLTLANPGKIVFAGLDSYIGARMPDSIGKLITGELVDQHFVENKITLFNFWFEGCPPCLGEIPELNEIVNKFGTEKFNYVAVGRETDANAVEVLAKHNWHFVPISNGDILIEKVFKPRWGYPTTMVVNQHGKIVSFWHAIADANFDVFVHHLDSLQQRL
jgi:thiol-disulfide isomerase/thioredoxin